MTSPANHVGNAGPDMVEKTRPPDPPWGFAETLLWHLVLGGASGERLGGRRERRELGAGRREGRGDLLGASCSVGGEREGSWGEGVGRVEGTSWVPPGCLLGAAWRPPACPSPATLELLKLRKVFPQLFPCPFLGLAPRCYLGTFGLIWDRAWPVTGPVTGPVIKVHIKGQKRV